VELRAELRAEGGKAAQGGRPGGIKKKGRSVMTETFCVCPSLSFHSGHSPLPPPLSAHSLSSAQQPPIMVKTRQSTPAPARSKGRAESDSMDTASPASSFSSKPAITRQATPFAKGGAKGKKEKQEMKIEKVEEEDEEAMSDVEESASNSASESEDEPSSPTKSLTAKFEAASQDEQSEGEEEGEESESGLDEEDEEPQRQKKKQKLDPSSSSTEKSSSNSKSSKKDSTPSTSTTPKSLTLTPLTQKELLFHLSHFHRLLKKLRAFQIKKQVRKLKEVREMRAPKEVEEGLERDLAVVKSLDLNTLTLLSYRMHNLHKSSKKINWIIPAEVTMENVAGDAGEEEGRKVEGREKELISLLLSSSAAKKHLSSYISDYTKKQRKDGKREKKLQEIEAASKKRKEKEKERKMKEDEREARQLAEKAAKALAAAEKAAASSDDEETKAAIQAGREKRRAEKLEKREEEKKRKKEEVEAKEAAAAAAAAKADESMSGSDNSDSEREEADPIDGPAPKAASKPSRVFSGMRVGSTLSGVISGIEKFGLFIEFVWKKKERKGLAHISMVSDQFVSDLNTLYTKGDLVSCIVTALDEKTGKISLGLKPSLFPLDKRPKPAQKVGETAKAVKPASTGKDKLTDVSIASAKLESVFVSSLGSKAEPTEDAQKLATIKRFLVEVQGKGVQKSEKKNRLGQRERRKLIDAVLGDQAEKKLLEERKPAAWKQAVAEKKTAEREARSEEAGTASSKPSSAPASSSSDPFDPSLYVGMNRKEKRLAMHRAMAARGEASELFVQQEKMGKFDHRGEKPKREPAPSAQPKPKPPAFSAPAKTAPKTYAAYRPTVLDAVAPSSSLASATAAPAAMQIDETAHPSWQAKQLQAAKLAAAPKGKKITFDD
jgi:predicted RNA-binding protein with RPS1 domain